MMDKATPYSELTRRFHEPNRLAIMSATCAAKGGISFTELRDLCALTDGNLSRHLGKLEAAGAVIVHKRFVNAKPKTTVHVTQEGLAEFTSYLAALENALSLARDATALPDTGALRV
ncbi:MAG: transcriptional regulator [Lentisphaeria bacterium]|nr:transcriptional regulator [Lentisphaeria bacterium]